MGPGPPDPRQGSLRRALCPALSQMLPGTANPAHPSPKCCQGQQIQPAPRTPPQMLPGTANPAHPSPKCCQGQYIQPTPLTPLPDVARDSKSSPPFSQMLPAHPAHPFHSPPKYCQGPPRQNGSVGVYDRAHSPGWSGIHDPPQANSQSQLVHAGPRTHSPGRIRRSLDGHSEFESSWDRGRR